MQKVIKFYGDNCAPCKAMAPTFDEVIKELEVESESLNIGDPANRQKAVELGIRSVPSFVAFNEQGSPFVLTGITTKKVLKDFLSNPR